VIAFLACLIRRLHTGRAPKQKAANHCSLPVIPLVTTVGEPSADVRVPCHGE
jgi:hypothetical protein